MKKYILSILKVLCLVAILFVALFPLVWMGITSGKSMTRAVKDSSYDSSEKLDLSSYYEVWVQAISKIYLEFSENFSSCNSNWNDCCQSGSIWICKIPFSTEKILVDVCFGGTDVSKYICNYSTFFYL